LGNEKREKERAPSSTLGEGRELKKKKGRRLRKGKMDLPYSPSGGKRERCALREEEEKIERNKKEKRGKCLSRFRRKKEGKEKKGEGKWSSFYPLLPKSKEKGERVEA